MTADSERTRLTQSTGSPWGEPSPGVLSRGSQPGPNIVDLWRAEVSALTDLMEPLAAVLSSDDQDRAGLIQHQSQRDCFIMTHGLLRLLMGAYLGARPERIVIVQEPGGKPKLAPSDGAQELGFSLSHSGQKALFAFTGGQSPGVDLEDLRREVRVPNLSRRFFHRTESQRLTALPRHEQSQAFLHYWTAKEAVLKATGQGLSGSLQRCRVTWEPGGPGARVDFPENDGSSEWEVRYVAPYAGYLGAVTMNGTGWDWRFFDCAPEFVRRLLRARAD